MTSSLSRQTANLAATARRIAATAEQDGWQPSDAMTALRAIDHLTASLSRLGPPAAASLAPAQESVEAMRRVIRSSPKPGDRAEDWKHRDMRVAERLWLEEQRRGGT